MPRRSSWDISLSLWSSDFRALRQLLISRGCSTTQGRNPPDFPEELSQLPRCEQRVASGDSWRSAEVPEVPEPSKRFISVTQSPVKTQGTSQLRDDSKSERQEQCRDISAVVGMGHSGGTAPQDCHLSPIVSPQRARGPGWDCSWDCPAGSSHPPCLPGEFSQLWAPAGAVLQGKLCRHTGLSAHTNQG